MPTMPRKSGAQHRALIEASSGLVASGRNMIDNLVEVPPSPAPDPAHDVPAAYLVERAMPSILQWAGQMLHEASALIRRTLDRRCDRALPPVAERNPSEASP